jgi:hypothetical protein
MLLRSEIHLSSIHHNFSQHLPATRFAQHHPVQPGRPGRGVYAYLLCTRSPFSRPRYGHQPASCIEHFGPHVGLFFQYKIHQKPVVGGVGVHLYFLQQPVCPQRWAWGSGRRAGAQTDRGTSGTLARHERNLKWRCRSRSSAAAGIIFVPGAGVLERGSSAGSGGHAHICQYCDVHGLGCSGKCCALARLPRFS